MKYIYLFIISFSFIFSFSVYGKKKLTLKKAHELVLKSQNGLRTLQKNIDAVEQQAGAIDGAYNPRVTFDNIYSYDASSKNQPFAPKKSQIFNSDVGLSKMMGTGTKIKFGVGLGFINSPKEDADLSTQEGRMIAGFTKDQKETTLDPSFKIEVSQPLLKGWMSKEIKLQKEKILGASLPLAFKKDEVSQALLYEMEMLFINYTDLEKQIAHFRRVKKDFNHLVQLMDKQKNLGRVDELAIEKTRFRALSMDLTIDTLMLEQKRLAQSIFLKCDLTESEEKSFEVESLSFNRALSFKSPEEAYRFAAKNRYDLKALLAKEDPARKDIDLVKEKSRPELDFFVSYKSNAKEEELSDSITSMLKQEHPQVSVGLKFVWKIGGDAYKSEHRSKVLALEAIESEKLDVLAKLKRDLEDEYLKLQTVRAKKTLNEKLFASLEKQKRLEKEKFLQARGGGEASLLSYDFERKEIEAKNLALKKQEEMAISQIKFLTHSY